MSKKRKRKGKKKNGAYPARGFLMSHQRTIRCPDCKAGEDLDVEQLNNTDWVCMACGIIFAGRTWTRLGHFFDHKDEVARTQARKDLGIDPSMPPPKPVLGTMALKQEIVQL